MAKILIAAGEEGISRMRAILGPHHAVSVASTIQDALEAAQHCDLVVCGLEFDESRMFDFLRELKAIEGLQEKPCISVRFLPTNTADTVIGGLELAAKAVGATVFLDLPEMDRVLGGGVANRDALAQIQELLPG